MAKVSQATFNLISQLEGNRLKPYLDTKGLATVGIGVQVENEAGNRGEYLVILGIAEKIGSAYRVKTLYNTDGTKNETATNALETVYNTINSALQTNTSTASMQTAIDNALSSLQSNSVLNNYKSSFHTTCEITNDESKVLFEAVAKLHVDTTDNFLNTITGSEKLVISQNSNEYAALFSLAYNNANLLLGDGLKHSIQYGNRAEAWFQIRYQSNADSVQAKRRYAESEVFGLYANPNNPTEKELKDFIRMYRLHKSTIDAYEATYSSRIGDANADLEKAGFSQRVNTLAVEVNQAKQRLASLFGEGVTIDGDVIVGVDTVNDDSADRGAAQINDTLQGTSKNDYLFGERGDDILIGNGGGDYMEGGEGYDTYYTNDKDTIYDSDGKGEVYFNGTLLVGGLFDESSGFYVSEDKSIKYQLANNTLKVKSLVDGSELTVEGYIQKEQSLGINLANSLGKEVAIVIDTTGSMRSSIDTAKQQAAVIAGNIFKSNSLDSSGVFSKVSIVTFSDDNIKTIGTYYNQSSFQAGINKVNIEGGGYEYHCRALMEGMSSRIFTY